MFIQIEPQSDIPIYTQLTQQIIEGIARGHLKPDDTLPSVRSLAADLGVNMHTVNKSYHELEKKKMIKIIPKSGAVICGPNEDGITDEQTLQIEQQLKPLIAEALVLGMTENKVQTLVKKIIEDLS